MTARKIDLQKLYADFRTHAQSGADLADLDPICEVLGKYHREHRDKRAGYILPNRAVALAAVRLVQEWEKAEWESE